AVGQATLQLLWGVLAALIVYGWVCWIAATAIAPLTARVWRTGLVVDGVVLLPILVVVLAWNVFASTANGSVLNGVFGGIVAAVLGFGVALFLVVTNLPLL